MQFAHLHCHTQFSLLDGAAKIPALYKKAVADGQKAIAITDHGNMFGVFEFVAEATKINKSAGSTVIKPIVGCEFYVVQDRTKKTFTKEDKDIRHHQLLLAKNETGYKNLVKLCSLGFTEGMYGKYPRIDKSLIEKYHEGLIATTCCIGAEVPQTILRKGEAAGEAAFKWWLDLFGEDYYVELQRHNLLEQHQVNEVLLKFAQKHQVVVIASNDSHYVDKEDYNAHDILLCINTGEKKTTPIQKDVVDEDDLKTHARRFGFPNDEFYFKTTAEMAKLFEDIPEAVDNTMQIADKVEILSLEKSILLPNFPIPKQFEIHTTTQFIDKNEITPDVHNQWEYLKHLTYEGAQKRYGEITSDIQKRLDFELFTIKTMGFAGYFLIVSDFIKAGRDLGVLIGPGRGSAAGSAVAYCIGITNIDPIKYDLLFERFLNPDRKSMPDIDTDFDDEGRQRVIDYVVDKYGKAQVAQIITYGTMAAKSSIKDVARVLDLPLAESNALAKLVPDKPGTSLEKILTTPAEGKDGLKEKLNYQSDEIDNIKKLQEKFHSQTPEGEVLREAIKLEGTVRNTGVHAAGVIIAPKDLREILPVATAKDSDLWVTQFEGNIIENAGVIKMDFLGLKTLTILRDAVQLIKQNHQIEIDLDAIPLTDETTYQLYQRGETNATFQFESVGMQKYLKELKPDKFGDLIAMNALYRPGPIEYIPQFIARKHGREVVTYDLPEMEETLKDTYGITVYQEQVMLLSQKLANFTKGDADVLRKAMGKKDRKTLDKLKPMFIENASQKGHAPKILEKIWSDWEAFASYAFNKSHSTCYAFVAFQTAYLKAHYPAEYMAAVLSNNMGNIEKITFFMDECKRMGLKVKGPDINESSLKFAVNKQGEIRYALSAIKGVGEAAVQSLLEERNTNGAYTSIFDLTKRSNLRSVNKKSLENLVLAGAFDSFPNITRSMYLEKDEKGSYGLEYAMQYGQKIQNGKAMQQNSLFGGTADDDIAEPNIPKREEWPLLEKLKKEKEVTGIYLSGHPLDDYKLEIQHFTNCKLSDIEKNRDKDLRVAGIVASTTTRIGKNGNAYAIFTLEDYDGSYEIALFGKDFLDFKPYITQEGALLHLQGRYQLRFRNSNSFGFVISRIELLSEIRQKQTQSVVFYINDLEISDYIIDEIVNICTKHPGSIPVKFCIKNEEDNFEVKLRSNVKIDLSSFFLADLNLLPELHIGLNNSRPVIEMKSLALDDEESELQTTIDTSEND
ncbi:MAG: DNA polymerase III subunit alpha [Chitinophagales bacterium]|nr:DNA polymerase III subunit alpha [Chitinophagales bacterium]